MNKSESKHFNTVLLMDQALLILLEKKDLELKIKMANAIFLFYYLF